MTAARSSGTSSPVCSPASSHSTQSQSHPVWPPACCQRHKRLLQTRLHLRSAPGVWLLLGVGVVLVGMAVAVAGYVSAAPKPLGGRGSSHSERMKLAGPVVMGVGLFIFICAATLLYENRDRELLKLETSDDLEGLKADGGWEEVRERPSTSCQAPCNCKDGERGSWGAASHTLCLLNENWGPPPPPRNRHNINSREPPLPPPPPGEGAGRAGREREAAEREEAEEEREGRSTLLTRVLHHQEPTSHSASPCPSLSHSSVYSDSCNSSEINFNIRTGSPLPSTVS
ncbi:transmembrane protein 200B-like [Centroberyx affinis]|uniref:transmembrane protein 200B-like n=1 Tax=Centroberyx affinis TaxID=166261 RepID=UPI003A5BB06B